MPGDRMLLLSTQRVPGVDVWWPQVAFVHAVGAWRGRLVAADRFCPRRGCLAWTFGGARLVLSTQGVSGVDVWWCEVGFVHAGGTWRGCLVAAGCFCPRRGCLVWMFGGCRLLLSTHGVPGVDVWWQQTGFVHAGMHFCGCFESGGIFANFAAYLAFYVRVY